MPQTIDEDAVVFVGEKLVNIVPNINDLKTEIRLFNLRTHSNDNTLVKDPAMAWYNLAKETNQFTFLCQLALACCTIFHGNAHAERKISKSHQIDDDEKRNCLSGKITYNTYNKVYKFKKLIDSYNI